MLGSIKPLFYIEALMIIGLLLVNALASREGRRQLDGRMMAMVLGMPPLGFLLPGGRYAYMAVILISLPLLARNRPEAARLYVTGLPLMPMLTFPLMLPEPIGLLFAIGTPEMLTLAFLITFAIHRRTGPVRGNALDGAAILLWLCMAIIAIHSATSAVTLTHVLRSLVSTALPTVIPYFLVSRSLVRAEHLRLLIRSLAISGLLLSVVALFEMVKHWQIYGGMYGHLGIDPPVEGYAVRLRGGFLRSPGSFGESTSFGAFLAVASLAVVYSRGLFRSRLHQAAAITLMIGGLLATSSRGGWAAFIVGLLCVQLYRGRIWRVVTVIGLCVAGYAMVNLVGSADPRLGEFLGVAGHAARTADYREDLLSTGLQQIMKRPVFGFDRPSLTAALGDMVQGEGIVDFVNVYLFVALSAGLVGLGMFLSSFAVLAAWLGKIRSTLRRSAEFREPLAFVVATAGGLGMVLIVQSWTERNPYWVILLFALGRALQRTVENSRKAARKATGEGAAPVPAAALPA